MVSLVVYIGLFLKPASIGDIGLNPDDGFDAALLAGHVELDGSVHRAMIRQSKSRHAIVFRKLNHIFDLREAVKQGIV